MPSLTLTISKLRFPSNGSISSPITVKLEYREYYSDTFILIDSGINVDVDGTILDSPLPTITIDTDLKYVIRATNEFCDFQYEQSVIINPYCPVGYEMAEDGTYCFLIEETSPTPPSDPQNSVAINYVNYGINGTVIYDPGYDSIGNGTNTPIDPLNTFWINSVPNTTDGPVNRNGLWTPITLDVQTVGFSLCITVPVTKTYYLGVSFDNYGTINIDGNTIISTTPSSLTANFLYWSIYPVDLQAGDRYIEIICSNVFGPPPNPAVIGVELYDNTAAEIDAATSYVGLVTLFRTQDYIGQPIQIGSGGFGFTCPDGFSLNVCDSPMVCRRVLTTPVLY